MATKAQLDAEAENVLAAIRDYGRGWRKRGGVKGGMRMALADETYLSRAIHRLLASGCLVIYRRSEDAMDWWYVVME